MNTPQTNLDRRKFLGTATLGAGASLLGLNSCKKPGSGGRAFSGQTLRVFVYSGAWEKGFNEHFVPRFEQTTGAKVVVDPGWWDSIPKLKASPPGQPAYDLVLTDATQGYPAIKEGMFANLEMGKIPNQKKLTPSALDNWVVKHSYGITFPESAMTLGYNKELCPQVPTRWGDLLDPKFDNALGLYNSFYMSLYTFACMKADSEGKAGSAAKMMAEDTQGIVDFAKANRNRVKLWWPTSTDMALNLTEKNCSLGNMHSTDMLVALQNSNKLGAVVPKDDRAFVLLMWVIAADSKVPDLAHEAINMLFSEDVQRGFAQSGQATAIESVAQEVAAKDPRWAEIYPSSPESLAAVNYYPYDTYLAQWDELTSVWDREILRKSS